MKSNIFLAILFAIVTTFTSLHGVEHIEHNENHDSASCLVCHVNGLESPDVISKSEFIQIIISILFIINIANAKDEYNYQHAISVFDKIKYTSLAFDLHFKEKSNQNRAPPVLS